MGEEKEMQPKPMLFVLETTLGQEVPTASMVMVRARKLGLPVSAVLVPPGLRGCVFIEVIAETEAEGRTVAEKARAGIKHAKKILRTPLPFSEVENFLVPRSPVADLEIGDIVDITAGPFKGEQGRIVRIDAEKEEVTVELLEATVPIPLRLSASWVKLCRKSE